MRDTCIEHIFSSSFFSLMLVQKKVTVFSGSKLLLVPKTIHVDSKARIIDSRMKVIWGTKCAWSAEKRVRV